MVHIVGDAAKIVRSVEEKGYLSITGREKGLIYYLSKEALCFLGTVSPSKAGCKSYVVFWGQELFRGSCQPQKPHYSKETLVDWLAFRSTITGASLQLMGQISKACSYHWLIGFQRCIY